MHEKKQSAIEYYTIGAITGLTEVVVTNPLFVIKTKIQQNKPWLLTPAGYYKGVTANALGFIPAIAIQVGVTEWIKSTVFNNQPSFVHEVLTAFTAGVLSSFISCPVEKIMTLQNDHPNTSLPLLLNKQLKTNGFSGFFGGQIATSLREGGFSIFFLATPPVLASKLKSCGLDDTSSNIIAGISSGIAATLVTQPVDTIKTIQQSAVENNLGFFKTAKNMTLSRLFHGIVARSSSVIISITLMVWVKKQLEHLCEEHSESIWCGGPCQ